MNASFAGNACEAGLNFKLDEVREVRYGARVRENSIPCEDRRQ